MNAYFSQASDLWKTQFLNLFAVFKLKTVQWRSLNVKDNPHEPAEGSLEMGWC